MAEVAIHAGTNVRRKNGVFMRVFGAHKYSIGLPHHAKFLLATHEYVMYTQRVIISGFTNEH